MFNKFINNLKLKFKYRNLRNKLAKYVEVELGKEYVEESLDMYDKVNQGIPIGGFLETVAFIELVNSCKKWEG